MKVKLVLVVLVVVGLGVFQPSGTQAGGHPNAEPQDTVMILDCDTGVENVTFEDGGTLADLIGVAVETCAEGAENHGQFLSCFSHLLNEQKKAGLISGEAKGALQRCAAQADIPSIAPVISGTVSVDNWRNACGGRDVRFRVDNCEDGNAKLFVSVDGTSFRKTPVDILIAPQGFTYAFFVLDPVAAEEDGDFPLYFYVVCRGLKSNVARGPTLPYCVQAR